MPNLEKNDCARKMGTFSFSSQKTYNIRPKNADKNTDATDPLLIEKECFVASSIEAHILIETGLFDICSSMVHVAGISSPLSFGAAGHFFESETECWNRENG